MNQLRCRCKIRRLPRWVELAVRFNSTAVRLATHATYANLRFMTQPPILPKTSHFACHHLSNGRPCRKHSAKQASSIVSLQPSVHTTSVLSMHTEKQVYADVRRASALWRGEALLPVVPRRLGDNGRAGFEGRRPAAGARCRRWRSIAEATKRRRRRKGWRGHSSGGSGDVPELQRQGSGGVFPVSSLHPCWIVGELGRQLWVGD